MSTERNYQTYKDEVLGGDAGIKAAVDAAGIVIKTDDKGNPLPGGDGEGQIRRKLSAAFGKLEEKKHGTFIDEDTGQRRNAVPERYAAYHNRLVEETYHKLVPADV